MHLSLPGSPQCLRGRILSARPATAVNVLAFYAATASFAPARSYGSRRKLPRAKTADSSGKRKIEVPYLQEKHGPIYCLNSLSKAIYWAKQQGSPDVKDEHHHENHRSLRTNLIMNALKGSPMPVPFYHLRDQRWRKRVGLSAELLSSCFVGTPVDETVVDGIMQSLEGESVSWLEAKQVSHTNYQDALADILRNYDKIENLLHHYALTLATINDPACPIRRFVALDIEAYEKSRRKLTEFGLATYCRDSHESTTYHIIIREHHRLRNREFAPDAKDRFAFGESIFMSTGEAMAFLAKLLAAAPGTALVGHSVSNDLAFLKNAKTQRGTRISEALLNSIPHFDIQHLYRCREGLHNGAKLETICEALRIPAEAMHNAGNDAALTLVAFLRLMKIGPYAAIPEPDPSLTENSPSGQSRREAARPAGWSSKKAAKKNPFKTRRITTTKTTTRKVNNCTLESFIASPRSAAPPTNTT